MSSKDDIAPMAHLLRRAGFGAPRGEIERRVAAGYESTVEELLYPEEYGIPANDEALLFRYDPQTIAPGAQVFPAQANWVWQMVNTQRPLQEKMTLFWHQLFATGNAKINGSRQMLAQISTFRRYALANYRDILLQMARDPAMIYWLDNNENHRDRPNENWGRELLELFSMGVGNYTETDVFECARAFTGWTMAPKLPNNPTGNYVWSFDYDDEDHDGGEKVFLGHRGPFNGEDIIDIVVRQPSTARFMARHLYNFFVADEPQVSAWQDTPPRDPVAINILGDAFISSGYEIRPTLRVLFNSDFFKEARFTRVKSPAEVVVGTMNLVGDFKGRPRPGILDLAMEVGHMGQSLLDPPSVEGWHTGPEWIDSGSLVRRINFVADRVADITLPGVRDMVDRVRALGAIPSEQLVEVCLDLMGPLEFVEQTRKELASHAAEAGGMSWGTEDEVHRSTRRVTEMLGLIASSREYQPC